MARTGPKSITKSFLRSFFFCPRYAYFEYCTDEPRQKTYAMLCGEAAHDCVGFMHRKAPASRACFYKTLQGLRNAWFGRFWPETLKEAEGVILQPSAAEARRYGAIGAKCLSTYWEQFNDLPKPAEVEKRYTVEGRFPLRVRGDLDQVRTVPLPWIKAHRPEIVHDDSLDPRYDPVIVLDLKSGARSYDPASSLPPPPFPPHGGVEQRALRTAARRGRAWAREHRPQLLEHGELAEGYILAIMLDPREGTWSFNVWRKRPDRLEGPTAEDWIDFQMPLFLDTQGSLYPWLYKERPDHEGRLPVAFGWHHLLTGKTFFTYPRAAERPGDNPFADLEAKIEYACRIVLEATEPSHWPRHEGLHCRTCEYRRPCLGTQPVVITYPEDFRDARSASSVVAAAPAQPRRRQLRLKFTPGWTKRVPEPTPATVPPAVSDAPAATPEV